MVFPAVAKAGADTKAMSQSFIESVSGLVRRIKASVKRSRPSPVLYNVNAVNEGSPRRRALLMYLVRPFLLSADAPDFLVQQNLRHCRQIAILLGEFNYIVDVTDVSNRQFKPKGAYDLVLKDSLRLEHFEPAPNGTIRLLLATTMDHVVHNRNLLRRHQQLFQRRGHRLQIRRLYGEKMPYAAEADAIVGVGNEYTAKTWRQSARAKIYPFNNSGFPEIRFIFDSKDFAAARTNFLFFASGSQVQKGLDLLLDIFPHLPDLKLYICSGFESEADFCACYHRELFETPNIRSLGWVRVNRPEFYQLVTQCAYVIYPSCSDGQAGSVVNCMHAGLIPVVTREAGIDTDDFGVTFVDDSLDEIERVVVQLAGLPETWHQEHSLKTRKVAEERYSEAAFMTRWRDILTEVLPGGG